MLIGITFLDYLILRIKLVKFKCYFILFFLILLFFDLFQIFSFLNGKHFQAINLKFKILFIHNFPIKNETKRKKTKQLFLDN